MGKLKGREKIRKSGGSGTERKGVWRGHTPVD